MTSKSYCVAPTLNNVAFVNNNTVLYDWNNNGVDYGTSGSIILEVSTNGGASYVAIGSVSPTSSPTTVSSPILNSITNGSSVKFRITANGGACVSQSSNVITLTWTKLSEIYLTDVSRSSTSVTFDLQVLYDVFNGKYQLAFSVGSDGCSLVGDINDTMNISTDPTRVKIETFSLPIGTHSVTLNVSVNDVNDSATAFGLLTTSEEIIDQISVIYSETTP